MQQTEHYRLNLIEPGDTFSTDPLNQNMEKVEAALDAARAEAKAGDGALDTRLAVLEARKIVVGTYTGTGESRRFVDLGFEARAVFAQKSGDRPTFSIRDHACSNAFYLEGTGFRVGDSVTYPMNTSGHLYYYIAIL